MIVLNRPLGQTAEDQLLLQVQGVIAEYERAKFLERSRRGKRHAAQEGRVGILCHAPYGYRSVNTHEGGGEARFEVVFDEAHVVKEVYTWIGEDRCTINQVCRRLHQAGIRTQTGKEHWDHKTIWDRLKNPAKEKQPLAKLAGCQSSHAYGHHEGGRPNPGVDTLEMMLQHTSGLLFPCLPSLTLPYSMLYRSSWKRIGDELASQRKALAPSCKVCLYVLNVDRRIVVEPMMSAMRSIVVEAQ